MKLCLECVNVPHSFLPMVGCDFCNLFLQQLFHMRNVEHCVGCAQISSMGLNSQG